MLSIENDALFSSTYKLNICIKGYSFLSFAKNMGKNIGKNLSKTLSGKYSQKLLDHAKNLLQMHLKLLQKE